MTTEQRLHAAREAFSLMPVDGWVLGHLNYAQALDDAGLAIPAAIARKSAKQGRTGRGGGIYQSGLGYRRVFAGRDDHVIHVASTRRRGQYILAHQHSPPGGWNPGGMVETRGVFDVNDPVIGMLPDDLREAILEHHNAHS